MPRLFRFLHLAVLVAAGAGPQASQAAPRIPASDDLVVEHLPYRNDPAQQALRRLRSALAAQPSNLAIAATLSKHYITLSREEGDPRFLGYAQAALKPWWTLPQPPVEVRVLRATILQSTHQFDAALQDLDAVLKVDPNNGQAWLTRSTVLTVQARYAEARASCAHLYRLAPPLILQACATNVDALNGRAARAYDRLQAALQSDAALSPAPPHSPLSPLSSSSAAVGLWIQTLLAEVAERLGRRDDARRHFALAMAIDPADSYLLGAYSDFLLDQDQPHQVIELLKDKTRNDPLLLRYAIALKAAKSASAAQQIQALADRFAAAKMRGDSVHRREQARFELALANQPGAALKTAQANWQVQKEPADARVFLEAAIAASARAEAAPILQWMKQSRIEDTRLDALAAALERR
jgi:tetratricopeptide (TPR) repeat protein